jgi:uncharacterized protein YyaL (SSP411 family)
MKKTVIIAGMIAIVGSVFALTTQNNNSLNSGDKGLAHQSAPQEEGLKWYSFEEGYAKAVREGKVLLIDAYTDWCGWCKVMDRKTYADPAVIAKLNESFICVKLNPETASVYKFNDKTWQGSELLQFLGNGSVTGFPTTIFWPNPSSDNNRYVQPGFLPPNDFSNLLDKAKGKKS